MLDPSCPSKRERLSEHRSRQKAVVIKIPTGNTEATIMIKRKLKINT